MSYDNTGSLGANSWRHVAFIEQNKPLGRQEPGLRGEPAGPPMSEVIAGQVAEALGSSHGAELGTANGQVTVDTSDTTIARRGLPVGGGQERTELRWLMASDVCKHCTHAACLDVCPTGSLFRTEYGTVVVQEDICNGCGYCVPACPYGVIDQRPDDGRVWKCTLCYDRLDDGLEPACAKACPTNSIQFGLLEDLRQRAAERVEQLHSVGVDDARLYGDSPDDGVGGAGAFFLLLDEPEVYGFPPDPVVTTRDLPAMYGHALLAAAGALAATVAVFAGVRR
jgi:formate dehydrogenase iron-sulfur subunit